MSEIWMVRAGEGGYQIDEFLRGFVGIGWNELGDMGSLNAREQIREQYLAHYPSEKGSKINNDIAALYKFRFTIKPDDFVVSNDTKKREYHIGKIISDYIFKPNEIRDYPHIRKVEWIFKIKRDDLSVASRNSLGGALTLFSVNDDVWSEINAINDGTIVEKNPSGDEETEEFKNIRKDIIEKAHEFIKDKILALSADEMEELAASILRGMGYKTRISPKGPDRGVDVMASPDGLGLETPRIKVEVKHRPNDTIGAQDLRSFIGGLREGDKGLFISTGGFSKDSKYEADRSNNPITLLDLDDLASLVTTHYENFDLNGRALIPLVKVYWPVE